MKIKVEVTAAELSSMNLDSVDEFSERIRYQLNECVDPEGEAGVDWMERYELNVVLATV